jgi:hypothetical protein
MSLKPPGGLVDSSRMRCARAPGRDAHAREEIMSKRFSYRPVAGLIAFLMVLLLVGGCGKETPDALTLNIDGQTVELPLERMDVFLVDPDFEKEFGETFEITGRDVVLVGQFPISTRVGYREAFGNLTGKPIAIAKEGGDEREPKRSSLLLPGGAGQALVESGTFTVNKVGKGSDAKTPVAGTVTLKLRTAGGEKTVTGTFKVRGTTWG